MLFVLFQLGRDRYALDASRIVEVLPLVEFKRLPHAPRGVAGIFNYRGHPVPALDLCELTLHRPASEHLSTRLLVVDCARPGSPPQLLGLIAERATETVRRERHDFVHGGVQPADAPYLGPVATDPQGLIQWIHEDRLLPDSVRESLFAHPMLTDHEGH